jgi:elongation factor P
MLDGKIFKIVEFQHIKPGKGGAFVRTKLRNLKLKTLIERTFDGGDKFEEAFIEDRKLQFLYFDGSNYNFMDQVSYEQYSFSKEEVGDAVNYLKENLDVTGSFHENRLLELNLPVFVDLRVEHTEPGLKGDTSKSGTKPARLESGVAVQVPLFITIGDVIRVDTRTGQYAQRA